MSGEADTEHKKKSAQKFGLLACSVRNQPIFRYFAVLLPCWDEIAKGARTKRLRFCEAPCHLVSCQNFNVNVTSLKLVT